MTSNTERRFLILFVFSLAAYGALEYMDQSGFIAKRLLSIVKLLWSILVTVPPLIYLWHRFDNRTLKYFAIIAASMLVLDNLIDLSEWVAFLHPIVGEKENIVRNILRDSLLPVAIIAMFCICFTSLKARDKLDRANRLKSQFFANTSHEIRTPLNGVIGSTEVLLTTDLDKRQRKMVEMTQKSGVVLMDLVNDLLDFSRMESGRLEIEYVEIDIKSILEEIVSLHATKAFGKGLELLSAISPSIPKQAIGDPLRIRQILNNLLSNAIKFTDFGEVALHAKTLEETDTHDLVEFTVTDTGIGIAEDSQSKIFEVFTQAGGAITRTYGGTGLGLAIVQELLRLMDGSISLESQPGKGTCFRIQIPFTKPDHIQKTDPRPQTSGTIRLLVIDDCSSVARAIQTMLSDLSIQVYSVDGFQMGIEVLDKGASSGLPFDAVLADVALSSGDFTQFVQDLRSNLNFASLKIIGMAEPNMEFSVQNFHPTDDYHLLEKPIFDTALLACLKESTPAYSPSKPSASKPSMLIPGDAQTIKLLLVEDNSVNQIITMEMLKKLDIDVVLSENGAKALEQLEHNTFDIVLMDCQMPVMDGYEATRIFRERENREEDRLPIIALTAHAMKGDKEKCLNAGMDGYIAKPFQLDDLIEIVRRHLRLPVPTEPAENQFHSDAQDNLDVTIDYRILNSLKTLPNDNDRPFLQTVIQQFNQDTESMLVQIRHAIQAGDARTVYQLAHQLRSCSMNIGAMKMSTYCRILETKGRMESLDNADTILDELELENQKAASILSGHLV